MEDISIELIKKLLEVEPGSGMVNSILLLLIWLNVKSLKKILADKFGDHEDRIIRLEVKNGFKTETLKGG